ncbi:GMP synthase-like glutamine amidotransferase [Acinetobacter calcoaceticus]|uniref:GMP synthase-like glutamine amidotransferase n=1 Tax=Acinetobacter calcoaceticus TaxID=471 RepID=A0A4R1YA54_ACICA|nr:GMP synthase-like glutamine amidotransferase [Acinetobacter calcoaceticus]
MMKKFNVHYFQHIAGEGFGSCYEHLKALGAVITATEFFALPTDYLFEIDALPAVDDVDLLIIMGGPMSVNDEANFPWLKVEKRWIRRYLATSKPALGLCLGGQLIANALGAIVQRTPQPEVGWSTVYKSEYIPAHCFKVPAEIRVLQWHRETFNIPKGAIRLAENSVCPNQLYQIGKNVLGFQFHPEITPAVLELFIEHELEENVFEGPYVQSLQSIKNSKKIDFLPGQQILNNAIDYVLRA